MTRTATQLLSSRWPEESGAKEHVPGGRAGHPHRTLLTVGLLGLALVVVAVAVWRAHPHWGSMLHSATHPVVPKGESHAAYWYFAIALLGSTMTRRRPGRARGSRPGPGSP